MDRISEIAAAIAHLQPEERQALFRLLIEQETLPAGALQALQPGGQESPGPSPAFPSSPDYVLVFDGGSKGNPGRGYGSYAITRVRDGAQRLERLELGQEYTNNEAEYDTLLAALNDLIGRIGEAGRSPQDFALEVRGDSSLVIHQIQGKWKANDPRMQDRRDRCRDLLRHFGQVKLLTQPREESVRVLGH